MRRHPDQKDKGRLHRIIYLGVLGGLSYIAFSLMYYQKDSTVIWCGAALWALLF